MPDLLQIIIAFYFLFSFATPAWSDLAMPSFTSSWPCFNQCSTTMNQLLDCLGPVMSIAKVTNAGQVQTLANAFEYARTTKNDALKSCLCEPAYKLCTSQVCSKCAQTLSNSNTSSEPWKLSNVAFESLFNSFASTCLASDNDACGVWPTAPSPAPSNTPVTYTCEFPCPNKTDQCVIVPERGAFLCTNPSLEPTGWTLYNTTEPPSYNGPDAGLNQTCQHPPSIVPPSNVINQLTKKLPNWPLVSWSPYAGNCDKESYCSDTSSLCTAGIPPSTNIHVLIVSNAPLKILFVFVICIIAFFGFLYFAQRTRTVADQSFPCHNWLKMVQIPIIQPAPLSLRPTAFSHFSPASATFLLTDCDDSYFTESLSIPPAPPSTPEIMPSGSLRSFAIRRENAFWDEPDGWVEPLPAYQP